MNDLMDLLIDTLSEFGLPEPDANIAITSSTGTVPVLVAWPEHKLALRQGHSPDPVSLEGWTIWECHDEPSARVALRAVGDRMDVAPNVLRLDFTQVKMLFDAGQYEAAKAAVEELEGQIDQGHPDWATCGSYIKKIRIGKKNAKSKGPQVQQAVPKISFALLVRRDAERASPPQGLSFNVMGCFSPEDESLSAVDALWLAQARDGRIEPWTVCVQGNPAYGADSNWSPVGTELEMLDGLLARLEGNATFVWGAGPILSLLGNWHYRVKGTKLSDLEWIDLQLLAQAAFPMAHRTDLPESLCSQLGIEFRDEMGLGGPLAAMLALIQKIAEKLGAMPNEERAALREVLSYSPDVARGQLDVWANEVPMDWGPSLTPKWLDFFVPLSPDKGFSSYLKAVGRHFREMPAMVQKSKGKREGVDGESAWFFKNGGLLSQAASFAYRERPEQIGFSQHIEECLNENRAYVLEAGTGIGKTMGYLVPALMEGKRTFVSTHTKSLQDQAWTKDVPLVLKALSLAGVERSVAIIKGKGNYVCLQTVADMVESLGEFVERSEDAFFVAALLNWLLETQTGWLSEIEHLGHWQMLNTLGRDVAPPKLRDEWADIDPHARARDASSKAELVLANHSYVFALANATDPSKHDVEALILDEAHNAEAVATEVLTLHFRPWSLLHELRSVLRRDETGTVRGIYRMLLNHPQMEKIEILKRFAAALERYEQKLTGWCGDARRRLNDMFPRDQDFDPDYPLAFDSEDFWITSLYASAQDLKKAMSSLAAICHDLLENLSSIKGLPKRISGSIGSVEEHLNDATDALEALFEKRADWVQWGEARARSDVSGLPVKDAEGIAWTVELHNTPLDIAGWLRETVNPLYKHRAYVSATLTVGGNFDAICERLGLKTEEEKDRPVTRIFPSPFDYRRQALLAVPHDMPVADPSLKIDPLYMEEQSKLIAGLAEVSEGRMLVLFTSNLMMREMAPRLQARLREQGILVLMQTDASRAALVDRLREAPRKPEKMVLLGLRSFWEGIDVPGEGLTVLTITRLPFEYHGHPVARARRVFYESRGHDRDYFRDVAVPAAFLHLRQMYGRLIRSETDRGATVISDPRIYVRRYGRALLQSLPETTTVVDKSPVVVDAVRRFLQGEKIESSFSWGGLPLASYDLSPEQRAIVDSPNKRILVRAAAGSGKTHVLITRLIRLVLDDQARPGDVLALTFTNKAMDVMYDRIEKGLGGGKAYAMHHNVQTYHKFAMRIIRQEDKEQGAETDFINEKNPELQKELLSFARRAAGLTESSLKDEDALTLIGYAQNGLVNETELEAAIPGLEADQPLMAKFARFFLAYVGLLRQRGVIDYGEAIVKAVRILRDNKDQAQKWSNRFKWIFCDEYQDTSPAQATLLQLVGQQANLFVVGDNNQSIYSWQGSDPDNLRRFELDFPNTATFNLSKNYRCFPKLVRMSARFLERAGEGRGLRIEYDEKRSTEEQHVYFLHNEDDRGEAAALAELVKTALALEIPSDPPRKATVGILARKWTLLEAVEVELIRQGIAYGFEGETARGIVASQKVRDLVQRAGDLVRRQENGQEFGDSAEGRVGKTLSQGAFRSAQEFLQTFLKAQPGEDLLGSDASDFNRLCRIMKDQPPSVVGRLFTAEKGDSRVVLSTVHSQKGEEFDTVVILGLEQGNSPHEFPQSHGKLLEWRKIVHTLSHATWRAPLTHDELQRLYEQEEKRIFYVAMTRARYNLVVSRAEERLSFGKKRRYQKSGFLDLSHDPKLVEEAASPFEVRIAAPAGPKAEEGYRSDGRVFESKCGILVRSKSEMLLANEFTDRGIYFEYEEAAENVANALPDFTFPDYGGAVLEHLGLLDDPTYLERWEKKARAYSEQGLLALRTNEEEIKVLASTVGRLQEQLRSWAEERYGAERIELIALIEKIRCKSGMRIGGAIEGFGNGMFEVVGSNDGIIAVGIPQFIQQLGDAARADIPFGRNMPGYGNLVWEQLDVDGTTIMIGRIQEKNV
jgi:ATP-dependent DNA helicase DinG